MARVIAYSIIETAQANELVTFLYLNYLFEKLPDLPVRGLLSACRGAKEAQGLSRVLHISRVCGAGGLPPQRRKRSKCIVIRGPTLGQYLSLIHIAKQLV